MEWVIGDIHGCYHTLISLLDRVKHYDSNAKFIFIGDYVDRGLLNKEVVDLMCQMVDDGAICLRGNHDDVIDYILNGQCECDIREYIKPERVRAVHWWMSNGLNTTLASYGISGDIIEIISQLDKIPQKHKDFFRSLPLYWQNDTHFACHGYMRIDEELPRDFKFMKKERYNETLWSRFERNPMGGLYLYKNCVWDKIGVFGHTPTSIYGSPTPIKQDKIRLIDTGSFKGEYLTAYNCEQDDWIVQATDSRDLPT